MKPFRVVLQAFAATSLVLAAGSGQAKVSLPVPYMEQPDNLTCLPTSFMMAINYLGRLDGISSDTVQVLHKTCQYNRFNTPPLAREFGLYALPSWNSLGWTSETIRQQLDQARPVVLGLNQGRSGHFVLAVGYTDDGRFIINNPTSIAGSPTLGGDHRVVEWDDLLFRGGVIIDTKPFPEAPPLSGVALYDGLPIEGPLNLTLTSGDDREVSFTLINNGRETWPKEMFLAPIDPESSPTSTVKSPMESDWISAERVTAALPGLEPETTGVITFKVKAPEVEKTTTFLQYYQLVDGDGNWFGTHWLAGPGNRNMGVRIIAQPKKQSEVKLPLVGSTDPTKLTLPWDAKYGKVELVEDFTTAPPQAGAVARLQTEGKILDSAWLGNSEMKDYRVEGWVWCQLRPKTNDTIGYERVGIFARDNGQHAGDSKTELEIGQSLAMTFDSDDGSVRAGDVYNGSIGDYRAKRFKITESGWHHFSISCKGNTASYELDGKPFHVQQNVRPHRAGDCGVFYNCAPYPLSPVQLKSEGITFSGFKVSEN